MAEKFQEEFVAEAAAKFAADVPTTMFGPDLGNTIKDVLEAASKAALEVTMSVPASYMSAHTPNPSTGKMDVDADTLKTTMIDNYAKTFSQYAANGLAKAIEKFVKDAVENAVKMTLNVQLTPGTAAGPYPVAPMAHPAPAAAHSITIL